jgi:D-beta-D-heptose 7-phosphate kinase/D-beta-D-heptose 1-phosphate adenosyltransferase
LTKSPPTNGDFDLTGARIVAVTLDAAGALIFERNHSPSHICSRSIHHHAAGAGDTFMSAMALALATGATTPVAADLAASAAAVVVEQAGTTACSAQELRQRLLMPSLAAVEKYCSSPSSLIARIISYRASGNRIVFTNGCFDILHAGHVSYLNRAKAWGYSYYRC